MTTQVIFKIDKELKKKAQKRAAAQGVSFSTVLKMATRSYVEGNLGIGVIPHDWERVKMTKTEITKSKKAREEFLAGRSMKWAELKNALDNKHRIKS